MKSFIQFIRESASQMNPAKLREYTRLVEEFKSRGKEFGLTFQVDPRDTTKTILISHCDPDVLQNFIDATNVTFGRQHEEKWPLPYDGCDAQVVDDDIPVPYIYFCAWLFIAPTENPEAQYEESRNVHSTPDADELYEDWIKHNFNDPDAFLDCLIGQITDLIAVYPKFKEYLNA